MNKLSMINLVARNIYIFSVFTLCLNYAIRRNFFFFFLVVFLHLIILNFLKPLFKFNLFKIYGML